MTNTVLFVDDDDDLRRASAQTLSLAGYDVRAVDSGAAAVREVDAGFDGIIISDIRMPGMDGLELLQQVIARDPDMPVILISGHIDVPTAMGALRTGAYDVLEKPYSNEQLVAAVERALERRRLIAENRQLRQAAPVDDAGPLVGHSPAIVQLRRTIAQIGPIGVDVLIQGETGTGKGLVAEMLHAASRRRGPLVTIDCGAMPAGLVEAELFGNVADAVPGSRMPRTGRLEQGNRGTIFLDDIDALSDSMQLAVQRVLERREVMPVGAIAGRSIDLRVVSASSLDLETLAKAGQFRLSLFYRLNSVTLRLPPLRERREDIAPLFRRFVLQAAARLGVTPPKLEARAFRHLEKHDWPGNVRELMRFAENFVLGLGDHDLGASASAGPTDLKSRLDAFETELIEEALGEAAGDVTRACAALGLPRKTFYYRLQKLGIDPASFRG
ncbi:MAG: sigma-54-dependent Fis family transcriptional regulator [Sphingobium sp.]|jgi:two-component system, NtrC family, C4-dicarboxylate transport response regulator DctD|uniref:Sigma-54-dependent Fis family transcriptional regulator n=1 Tax=Sphingobium xenophagum TaxID=121428 RepID=A0A249MY04_SPHXE|nr:MULTISPECIES: sigma-54 dependent transcriptional regulator [Sphingobium]MBU0658089.1 sigma-54 dependent transcriptional regulator [Alphaproteobacteria bacterium]ASY46206.1 sigma-54-dependent Fis family transcriptional regulator [Sphingobium xenophagum]MBA4756372.1 sigma-54-dependent Fis family transcriptional regulator [Sphingobium sp.]MBS89387.1 sigma-54-dependent Fis family transcriptional regulator [Sphingobium sp.]MBU0775989.1 sigma-54 dependent transcriptional regulator [Alphaproteobac